MTSQKQTATLYWVAWSHLVRGNTLRKIFAYFPSGETAWYADRAALTKAGLRSDTIEKIINRREAIEPEKVYQAMCNANVKAITPTSEHYPALLRQLFDLPIVLYYRGTLPTEQEKSLAVVGTRRFTSYGKTITLQLVRQMVESKLTIVSGLARGIDALAHLTTLDCNGRTVGVLGSGLAETDIYPSEHRNLAKRIVENGGLLLSEYPPGTAPERHYFPERNRIIAGLSHGTLVIEAPESSGALITTKAALEYNREVLAVPGRVGDRTAAGTNALLKLGARPVTEIADILAALDMPQTKKEHSTEHLDAIAKTILSLLNTNPCHIDSLYEKTEITPHELSVQLTKLELSGLAKDIGGKNYIRLTTN